MRKANKKNEVKAALTTEPLSCIHRADKSQIEAYITASGEREIIGEIFSVTGIKAKAIAEFIITAINNIDKREHLIDEMEAALDICLACEGLDWAAEHDAEIALRHSRQRIQFH